MLIPILFLFMALSGVSSWRVSSKMQTRFRFSCNLLLVVVACVCLFRRSGMAGKGYSENWAKYGFFFISLPIMIMTSVLAITSIVTARLRKIENVKKIEIILYLLLAFQAAQVVIGFLSA